MMWRGQARDNVMFVGFVVFTGRQKERRRRSLFAVDNQTPATNIYDGIYNCFITQQEKRPQPSSIANCQKNIICPSLLMTEGSRLIALAGSVRRRSS